MTYLRPWLLSLEVATAATCATSIVGIPLAYMLSRKSFPGRSVLESVLILPLILPPTVVGFLLMYLVGRHGAWGWLTQGGSLLFTIQGAMIASSVVSFPLVVLPARSAFSAIGREYFEEARMIGASPFAAFLHIAVPIARRGIVTGLLLGFGRALGEFGATIMLVGTGELTRTLPLQIYVDAGQNDDFLAAWPAVLALALTSLAVVLLANRSRWFENA
jgi:molybdate transport system permease protein